MPLWNFRKKKSELSEQIELPLAEDVESPSAEDDGSLSVQDSSELAKTFYEVPDTSITASGLYPHEVLILDFADTFFVDQEDFPTFWRREYGILQMPKLLASLVDRGFLIEAPMKITLEAATVPALKQALKKSAKTVGGKKAELIDRLLYTVPEGELYALFPKRTFALTSRGAEARDEATHIPYIHRRPVDGLNIWSLHRLVVEHPEKSFRELIWAHLEATSQELAKSPAKHYAAYRAIRYRMYQFLMEESRLKRAFPFLAEVIYYDLSGIGGDADTLHRYISEKYFFPYDRSIVKLSATCVQAMGRLQTDLGLSDEMLKALFMQFFERLSLPSHLFTVEECAVIVLLELRGDTAKLREVYKLAEARFNQRG
jgi:hypothetical protein